MNRSTKSDSNCAVSAMAEKFVTKSKTILKRSGARITKPRVAVIQCLALAPGALSPREILELIEKDVHKPDVDQVSVYRILEILRGLGLVHCVYPSGGFIACTHIGCQAALHILVHCRLCDGTQEMDIPGDIFAPMQWYLKKEIGFIPQDHLIQIDGTCCDCTQDNASN